MISNEKNLILNLLLQMFVHATNENDQKKQIVFFAILSKHNSESLF